MITITINTDNAAFDLDRDAEVTLILEKLIQSGWYHGMAMSDTNGNYVGEVTITKESE